ncbi:chloramphenicol phosphotransferase CPT [Amycolatopsis thailandensis]|uniref:chloramphenicol phosphotransferase CPT n=1 Tax=Amycolatopsis thailandensis TaxID=589330 RepID=UPI0036619364
MDIDDRLADVRFRPAVYGISTLRDACVFLYGFNAASENRVLRGFQEWVDPGPLVWASVVSGLLERRDPSFSGLDDASQVAALFDLVAEFRAERGDPLPAPPSPRRDRAATRVIVLNGGSSSGKSAIARSLQTVLPEPWLTLGVDTLIDAMPASVDEGIDFAADGGVSVGSGFRRLEDAWMTGVAAMARAGARVIIDDVFLGGAASQQRWRAGLDGAGLDGLDVLWVGVRCDGAVAAAREAARGDRVVGMAETQAEVVHRGVVYDLEVDTGVKDALDCAREIAARIK